MAAVATPLDWYSRAKGSSVGAPLPSEADALSDEALGAVGAAKASVTSASTFAERCTLREGGAHGGSGGSVAASAAALPSEGPLLPSGSTPSLMAAARSTSLTSGGMRPVELGAKPAKPVHPWLTPLCRLPQRCCMNVASPDESTPHTKQRRTRAAADAP